MASISDLYVTFRNERKKVKFVRKFGMSTLRFRSVRPARTWILLKYVLLTNRHLAGEKCSHVLHRLVPTTTVNTRMAVFGGS
jgi:hypothetical protein